jgi:UDP-glucose 4-epimerase
MTAASLAGTSVLVVGGSGFLGSHVARRACALGARVTTLSRRIPSFTAPEIMTREGDASDPARVAEVFTEAAPDLVYQLTSDSRGGREAELIPASLRNDVIATLNVLLEAQRRHTSRVVMTGSLEEPTGDAAEAVPSSPYAAAKGATATYARMMAALHHLPVVVLRLMMTYGPGQKPYKVIPATILALLRHEPIQLGSGTRRLDWIYVDDVTEAFLRAGVSSYPGAASIDIGSGQLVTLRECLSMVGDLIGRPDLLQFGAVQDRALEMEKVADIGRAERLLGWRPSTSLKDGLRATIRAYAEDLRRP